MVRGYKHLHECAYIGDDSSEEEDELAELKAEEDELIRKAASDAVNTYKKKDDTGQVQEGESNEPTMMRRARPGVILHNTNDPFDSTEQVTSRNFKNLFEHLGHKFNILVLKVTLSTSFLRHRVVFM